jgi:hypothetical protein
MKISVRFLKVLLLFLFVSVLLAPLTVIAQTGDFYVIAANRKLKNIVTVAKSNGDFTDPVTAVDSISDASSTNPYLVVIGPGVYTISRTLVMKSYVHIAGSGRHFTTLTGTISTDSEATSAIVSASGVSFASLSSIALENKGGHSISIAIYNNTGSPTLRDIYASAYGGTSKNYVVYNYNSASPEMTDMYISTYGGGTDSFGVYNYNSSPLMSGVTTFVTGGTGNTYGVYNSTGSWPMMTKVSINAMGGSYSYGIYNEQSCPTMIGVTAEAHWGTTSMGVYNSISSCPSLQTMTDVIATAMGVTTSYGIQNYYASPLMTGVSATASSGEDENYGVINSASSPTMNNVTATGSGGGASYGVYNYNYSQPAIRRSTIVGNNAGLYADDTSTARVSQSTIISDVGGAGTKTCVACDDGNGAALNANCSAP